MEWIKCSDKLPKTNQDVLIVLGDETILLGVWKNDVITRGHHWEAYWQNGLAHVIGSGRLVTHWAPLPEPPKP